MKANTILILGGLALVGVGAYVLIKKSQPHPGTATAPSSTTTGTNTGAASGLNTLTGWETTITGLYSGISGLFSSGGSSGSAPVDTNASSGSGNSVWDFSF